MNRRIKALTVMAAATATALAVSACDTSSNSAGDTSGKTLVIGVDLPFQGESKDASDATYNAMQLYLDQVSGKAGKYKVKLVKYDDSTAATGKWDETQCKKNANDHVANADEVAVMGTYNSGCAKIEAPILNQDTSGPLLMVSHANTNPGLTKAWDAAEPQKYQPSGKRNYARVVTTDDYQGTAAAQMAKKDLNITKCYVLDDNETYGQGVARAFKAEAEKQGIAIAGSGSWDGKQPNYTALFTQIKGTGADCLYVGGIYDNNGGQLVKDKVKVLGDNNKVKFIGPDGFVGYPDLDKQAESKAAFLTYPGLDTSQLRAAGGKGAALLDAYKAKYGADPATPYALYGVQALQVMLSAIEKSDGTRKGVRDAVFEGSGITIAATDSMLGKDVHIDPASGDVTVRDIAIFQEKGDGTSPAFVKAWPVS
jgi:branched-chain amino acid transport system substrate-binding protein